MNFPDLHLANLDFEPWMIGVIIPVAGLVFAGVLIVTNLYFQNRRREMWHQTARLALEKGQPLPEMPKEDAAAAKRGGDSPADDLRAGLICIAAGVGLYLFLGHFINQALGYVGTIPGFIGVALLISGIVRLLVGRKASANTSGFPRVE